MSLCVSKSLAVMALLMLTKMSWASGGTLFPERCLQNKVYPCAVYTYDKSFFEHETGRYDLAPQTLVELSEPNVIVIHRGTVWIHQKNKIEAQTIYGRFHLPADSETLINVQKNNVTIQSLGGSVEVTPRGDSESLSLSTGLQMVLGPIDFNIKKSTASFPKALNLRDHLKWISALFPYSEMNFQNHIDRVALVAVQATKTLARWNQTIVERKIAHVKHVELRQKYKSAYEKERTEYLLRQFRLKNNFEE